MVRRRRPRGDCLGYREKAATVSPHVATNQTAQPFSALEAVPVALLVVDDEGRIAMANSALERLFEYEPGELLGQPVEVLVPAELAAGHPELREAYAQVPCQRVMGSGRDLHGVTKTGRRVAIEIGLNTMAHGDERFVTASILDLGPLRAEEVRARLAMDASASAMVMVDGDNEIVLVNQQAVNMFGYQRDQLVGQPIEVLVPERYRRRHHVYRDSYRSAPSKRAMGGDRALHGQRADGTEFPLEIGLTPIEHQNGLFTMATIIDITERELAREEIERQNADLQRLNAELGQFAYSASHDLKAPLATLDGLLLCLQDDIDDNDLDVARANASTARELTQRLAELIEGILGFAEADHLGEQSSDVDVSSIIEDLRSNLDGLLTEHGVELRNRVPAGMTVTTVPRRLIQVLENLTSNGAKFANQTLDECVVEITAAVEGDNIVLAVSDNGIGIPTNDRDQVFAMFRRFANHDQDGTGLGLALVEQHVDRLGGSIAFETGPDGTTFTIFLPRGPVAQGPVPRDPLTPGDPSANQRSSTAS